MATNCTINGKPYYRITRIVGKKLNKNGLWVDNKKQFYGKTKKEAENKYKEYIENTSSEAVKDYCFGEFMEKYINEVFIYSDLANSTKQLYIRAYEVLLKPSRLAGLPLQNISALDLQALYNEKKDRASAVKNLHSLLKRFFKFIEAQGYGRDFTHVLTLPKKEKAPGHVHEVEVWQSDEVKTLINGLNGSLMRFLVVLAINTGGRISELLALKYDDIKDNAVTINKQVTNISAPGKVGTKIHSKPQLSKTKTINANRIIPLSAETMKEFYKHKALHTQQQLKNGYRTDYIFTTDTGNLLDRHNVTTAIDRACKRLDIQKRPFHAFRHTFGSNLAAAGISLADTAKLMGHSNVNTTMKYYINVSDEKKRKAVEMIDILASNI